ncbi:MAG: 3'(2'),5'-bisphosphate nucleotidase CysQ [Flavobacteriales bacterium]|nr:3'(2'),5'-bisphosphate nucleotidase CysQ [Flavobacteriales bacterium]MBP9178141.1 3'(2'),5'-bisphosphate nucleotidase CysQ [Flavobacteriales bacterium]MCC6911005.1 3'(2'),5'-bisphosphate nucleotidase CysQ [Flavobacteriales bacterium]
MPMLTAAIEAALAGGAAIMEVYAGTIQVTYKEDRSPLTEADERSNRAISKVLAGTGIPILSEEGASFPIPERQAWEQYWLVDPLDGTKEFVKRNDEFAVCIALMQRDQQPAGPTGAARPILGVIYAPVLDKLYFATQGHGAFLNVQAATRAGVSAYERVAMSARLPNTETSAYTILASRSHRSPETEAFIVEREREHGTVEFASMGSALKFGLVAEGAANVYPRYAPTMEWDTGAGQIICAEAGKELIDVTTNAPMRYNKHELVNNWFVVQ